jgi:hypothetical protein
MTCLILFLIQLVPGLKLRATEEDEVLGIDDAEIGEFAYDYVELSRDVIAGESLGEQDSGKMSEEQIMEHEKYPRAPSAQQVLLGQQV